METMKNKNTLITELSVFGSDQVKQIERAKREWEVTVDVLPQLICLLDHEGCILRANRTVERWQLGEVVEVKGREIHEFLHAGCRDPACGLLSFLDQAWSKLVKGQPAECEVEDELLKRHLSLQIHPLSSQTIKENGDAAIFAVLVLDDISEQKRVEVALRQYALELKTRNEELDAFAHTVAHNLKGSLTPIIGNAELLRMRYDTMPVEAFQKDLEIIAQSGQKIDRIIDELLLLAGVRKMEVEMEPLDMAAIIAEVQNRLAYMIEEYQAELTAPAASEWPAALGYGPWVEEVWANYLSNAIKYGGRPPQLELGATVFEQDMIRFWVRDNGSGLKPEEQARLFTPFTQLNHARVKGHGLGLSIVRRIVEKMGGQVGVESEGIPGRGCVFSFVLPRVPAARLMRA